MGPPTKPTVRPKTETVVGPGGVAYKKPNQVEIRSFAEDVARRIWDLIPSLKVLTLPYHDTDFDFARPEDDADDTETIREDELEQIYKEISNFTSGPEKSIRHLMYLLSNRNSIRRFRTLPALIDFVEKEISAMVSSVAQNLTEAREGEEKSKTRSRKEMVFQLAKLIKAPMLNLKKLSERTRLAHMERIAEVISEATGIGTEESSKLIQGIYSDMLQGIASLKALDVYIADKLLGATQPHTTHAGVSMAKHKLSTGIWQLHTGPEPWDQSITAHIHGLKQNQHTIKNTSRELNALIKSNPLAWFSLGYDKVPDEFFLADKPKFSDWTHQAAKNLATQDPHAYIGLGMHLKKEFDDLLTVLYDTVSGHCRLNGAELKKKDPALFKQILKVVESISLHHPAYFVKWLANDPAYKKILIEHMKTANLLCTLIKVANRMDELKRFDLADRIDAILRSIGETNA